MAQFELQRSYLLLKLASVFGGKQRVALIVRFSVNRKLIDPQHRSWAVNQNSMPLKMAKRIYVFRAEFIEDC